MTTYNNYCLLFFVLQTIITLIVGISINVQPQEITLTVGEDKFVQFYTIDDLPSPVDITLRQSDLFDGTPHIFRLDNHTRLANIVITGLQITSRAILKSKMRY
ncbi:hypothetical protein DINM_004512 [Dirofilaria immitis]|nr:hypothetical protein [Dirofilaria immitis]